MRVGVASRVAARQKLAAANPAGAWASAARVALVQQGIGRFTYSSLVHAANEVCLGAHRSAAAGYVDGPGGNWSARILPQVRAGDFLSIMHPGERISDLMATFKTGGGGFQKQVNLNGKTISAINGLDDKRIIYSDGKLIIFGNPKANVDILLGNADLPPADKEVIGKVFQQSLLAMINDGDVLTNNFLTRKVENFFVPGFESRSEEISAILRKIADESLVLIKGTGFRAEDLTPDNNAFVRLSDGQIINLPRLTVRPSCEWPMHLASLRVRGDINAVCHTHPSKTITFATMDVPMEPGTPDVVAMLKEGKSFPRIPYVFPASDDLARNISDAIRKGQNEVLMANHGLLTVAPNMTLAFDRTALVEHFSETLLGNALLSFLASVKATGHASWDTGTPLTKKQRAALLGSDFEQRRQQMADKQ